jgi:hypothetical protein
MKLFQTEINAEPGNRPNRNPRQPGWVGDGTAVLEVHNPTEFENAFSIRLVCDRPYWQAKWYQLLPLPTVHAENEAPPPSKPDLHGKLNQTLKIHVGAKGTRQILIQFTIPRSTEARAGAYPFRVVIEASISDRAAPPGSTRTTEILGTLIVRPFYEYHVEYDPPEQTVKIWPKRRKAEFNLLVRNRGNDWLYTEIRLGKPKDYLPYLPTTKVAVPPPEPGGESVRAVPFSLTTKLKVVKGSPIEGTIPLTVHRIDAPSIPPLPDEVLEGGAANLGASVTASDPREELVFAEPGVIRYKPPVPNSLLELFQGIWRSGRGIVLLIVGLFALYTLAAIVFDRQFRVVQRFDVASGPTSVESDEKGPFAKIQNNAKLELVGVWLDRAQIEFYTQEGKDGPSAVVTDLKGRLVSGREFREPNVYAVSIDLKNLNSLHDKIITYIVAKRRLPLLGSLPFLNSAKFDRYTIRVGSPILPKAALPPIQLASNELSPEDDIKILGPGLGSKPGKILLAGETVKRGVKWSDARVTVPVPTGLKVSGNSFNLQIILAGESTPIVFNGLRVKREEINPSEIESADLSGGGGAATGGEAIEVLPDPATQSASSAGDAGSGNASMNSGSDPAPAGYAELLSAMVENRPRAYATAIRAISGSSVEEMALRAYALSASGRVDEAAQDLPDLETFSGSPRAMAYLSAAWARVSSDRGNATLANRQFLQGSKKIAEAIESGSLIRGEGNGFPDLAYALFKRDVKGRKMDAERQANRGKEAAGGSQIEVDAATAISR